ncbi:MAG: dihydroorotate dehydrogenase [Methanocellales archaeon]|nr:dihydroorotate dehydrogenase [Methanocellales archaeon]MDD3292064.1 dihydroorotate dehydrogenase [Methanocellales archaeon]MDD5235555.1 dihydroorotate dehydrogenase [Methanocellales archaeon]MDD5485579.1 dihydroorotate dehydrogenase [Methanocellales archaeon]
MDLTTNVTGLQLRNPTILAAGILGSTASSLKRVMSSGAGAVVTKSIGVALREGHPGPVMIQTEHGFLNAIGLANPSYHEFTHELKEAKGEVPVIVSIFGRNAEEFKEVALGLIGAGPDAFELNLSCPHAEGYGASLGEDPNEVEKITRAVKEAVNVPVWVKLPPLTSIVKSGLAAQKGGADAVVAINTLPAMAIDIESRFPVLGNISGGLSGAAIKPVALKCVYDLYAALNIDIIGVGGVSSWRDALEFILAGASAIEIGSAVYEDMDVFRHISEGIARYLQDTGCDLEDVQGAAVR